MVSFKRVHFIIILFTISFIFSSCNVTNQNLSILNTCYKISEETFYNGFKKDDLDFYKNDNAFILALDNNLYDSCYTQSAFKDRSFYFTQDYKKYGNEQYQISRCKDTLIAMHLAYTLAYDSENYQKEFMIWYPTIDFYLSNHSEFVYLISEHYDLTEAELNIIINSFTELSKECTLTVDKYKALNTAYFLVTQYNESSDKSVVFPKKLDNELKEYSEYVKENPDEATFWMGYTLDQSGYGSMIDS